MKIFLVRATNRVFENGSRREPVKIFLVRAANLGSRMVRAANLGSRILVMSVKYCIFLLMFTLMQCYQLHISISIKKKVVKKNQSWQHSQACKLCNLYLSCNGKLRLMVVRFIFYRSCGNNQYQKRLVFPTNIHEKLSR